MDEQDGEERSNRLVQDLFRNPRQGVIHHVGWGGDFKAVKGRLVGLGVGIDRGHPKKGFRRAVFDFCLGYVSGFRVRDIIYYIFTRPLNPKKNPKWKREAYKIETRRVG